MIRVKPKIGSMAAYQPPWSGMDRTDYIRLDLNENTRKPAASVLEALTAHVQQGLIGVYPDTTAFVPLLADYVQCPADHLLPTNGSDQALELVIRAFLDPGDSLLVARPEFAMISHIAAVIGAQTLGVPYGDDLTFPTTAFEEAAASRKPQLIVVINPNNPTGTAVDMEAITRLVKAHPDTPVLVDEAYYEYTGQTALPLLKDHPNLLITRTFSKAFAMAGLRLGYVIARPELIAEFQKVRGPFDVNSCAIVAGMAQLREAGSIRQHIDEVHKDTMPRVLSLLQRHGVKHKASPANFLLVWPDNVDRCVAYLKDQRILVRKMGAPGIEGSFRMSLGTSEEMTHFVQVFDAYLRNG